MIDDQSLRDAMIEAWGKTLESGRPETAWERFWDNLGFGKEQAEHGFVIYQDENGDYWASPVTEGGPKSWSPPEGWSQGNSIGTGHTHTQDSKYGAVPSHNPRYGDTKWAADHQFEDNILIGYDPENPDSTIITLYNPYREQTYDSNSELGYTPTQYDFYDMFTPCTGDLWVEHCCPK
jgi:hypothetical protein